MAGTQHRTHSSHACRDRRQGQTLGCPAVSWEAEWADVEEERREERVLQWRKKSEKRETKHRRQSTQLLLGRRKEGGSDSEARSKGGRELARESRKGGPPAVWKQGQRGEKCQSGLNHWWEAPQVEEMIKSCDIQEASEANKNRWDKSWYPMQQGRLLAPLCCLICYRLCAWAQPTFLIIWIWSGHVATLNSRQFPNYYPNPKGPLSLLQHILLSAQVEIFSRPKQRWLPGVTYPLTGINMPLWMKVEKYPWS